ncbi:MAG TPA: hybrid sensor histidine kinase/response regulator [Rhodocyclaceae bacterium]|nr:hybrid sensor histidine kinase/response regulator [Rhodocyclaceae bacterium]
MNSDIKLLIVDDLPDNLLALEALIRCDGCAIYQASSGEEALTLLLEHEFALAILDVQMIGMTGFELAELMRGMEKTRHIPIVFVTAAGRDLNYAFKGYESGAVDFLYKPLDVHAVKSKVNVFVDLYRQRQEVKRQVTALEEARRQQDMLLAELQTAEHELQDALQIRDQFMSMVAHELRTPLSVLSLDTQVRQRHLEQGNSSFFSAPQLTHMFSKDLRQVKSMSRLIEDMLDVSRIRNGKLSIRPSLTNLSWLLDRLVEDFSNLGGESAITLTAEPDVVGMWDEFRIEQIIVNLLTNALRYGASQPIEVTLRTSNNAALIVVRDHGIGIAPEEQERIFEQFVRVADRSSTGLGLGLYITKQLAAAHSGAISVESRLGKGSAFTVKLPLNR